jgi:hypothetical protein
MAAVRRATPAGELVTVTVTFSRQQLEVLAAVARRLEVTVEQLVAQAIAEQVRRSRG